MRDVTKPLRQALPRRADVAQPQSASGISFVGACFAPLVLYVARLLAVEPDTPWETCIVRSVSDGPLMFALFRMRGDYKRLIVHVTVDDDWARTSDELVDNLPVGADLDQASFFRAEPSVLIDFLRFRRGFTRYVLEDVPAWKAQLESMTKAILRS